MSGAGADCLGALPSVRGCRAPHWHREDVKDRVWSYREPTQLRFTSDWDLSVARRVQELAYSCCGNDDRPQLEDAANVLAGIIPTP